METTLDLIQPGQSVTVRKVEGEGKIRVRIFDMGITPGVELKLVKKAPLGDPLEITVRGYQLTLRKSEASAIVVEYLD